MRHSTSSTRFNSLQAGPGAIGKWFLKAYFLMAKKAGKIWREHGALEYQKCADDDLKTKLGVPFPRSAKAKSGRTVVFSWIVY
jgi:uncharacterized protein YbaA (DUF1428 family)